MGMLKNTSKNLKKIKMYVKIKITYNNNRKFLRTEQAAVAQC